MSNLKKQYRDLETKVLGSLRDAISKSKYSSKHLANEKALEINVFDYTELAIVNDELTFLDNRGLHYSIWNGDAELEDLIDILSLVNLED